MKYQTVIFFVIARIVLVLGLSGAADKETLLVVGRNSNFDKGCMA